MLTMTLDLIAFFCIVQVVLPNMMSTGSNASYRFSQAQNRGNGSTGWLSLKNLKSKKNQY